MKIFHIDHQINLRDYGILIPFAPSRAQQILSALSLEVSSDVVLHFQAKPIARNYIEAVHDSEYVRKALSDSPEESFFSTYELQDHIAETSQRYQPTSEPFSGLVYSIRKSIDGVQNAFSMALTQREDLYVVHDFSGAHHAMSFGGRGFCLFHDIVIALEALGVASAWIVDTDAHKGDGTAQLCLDRPQYTTLSIHMAQGWPLDDGWSEGRREFPRPPWHIPSSIDIPIAERMERTFLPCLREGLSQLQARSPKPELIVVVAGSDPWEHDALPSSRGLRLTARELFQRDQLVYSWAKSMGVPQVWLMAGGYGPESYQIPAQFLRFCL